MPHDNRVTNRNCTLNNRKNLGRIWPFLGYKISHIQGGGEVKILLYACFKYCTNYIVYHVKSVSKSIFSKNLSYFMNPLFIHKQHIYLECTTTLNDREDLHLLYKSITQMSSLNVQGNKNAAGASACRDVSCRFLHGFCVPNRCLLEKPQDNLL